MQERPTVPRNTSPETKKPAAGGGAAGFSNDVNGDWKEDAAILSGALGRRSRPPKRRSFAGGGCVTSLDNGYPIRTCFENKQCNRTAMLKSHIWTMAVRSPPASHSRVRQSHPADRQDPDPGCTRAAYLPSFSIAAITFGAFDPAVT